MSGDYNSMYSNDDIDSNVVGVLLELKEQQLIL